MSDGSSTVHVMATAGHVDHGKSTLIRAITGMEPDRWSEERRRGMTIDLGYAWTTLGSGNVLSFVDVPGHARFIGNMLAGLGPVPSVLFVVAADQGWCRQSREHLAAIDALGVQRGVLAITRSDLSDPVVAQGQALAALGQSSLHDVEAVQVSSLTGQGLNELRGALDRLVARTPRADGDAPVRLWVDRCFTIRGAGNVVTGTLSAGTLTVGDQLELDGRMLVVRGLQSLGVSHRSLTATARVAVNLRGTGRDQVTRGQALLTPGAWKRTATVDVRLRAMTDLPEHLVLHVGTAAVAVRVRPLGGEHARLSLERSLPLAAHDRLVLREPAGQLVVGGAVVVDPGPPELRRRGAASSRAADLSAPDLPAREVARLGAVRATDAARFGAVLQAHPGIVDLGEWLVDRAQWNTWLAALTQAVDERDPLRPRLSEEEAA